MDVKVTENSSRSEKLLGKMTGDYAGETEKPQSRIEALLEKLAESAGEGKIDHALFAKKSDLADYAKKKDIPSLKGYAKASDIPSLDGYAKTTDIPSLNGYAKTSDIPSLDDYVKKEDLQQSETVTTVTETKKQETQLSASFPDFYLVNSVDEMSDKKAVYLIKNSDDNYSIYIWQTDYSDYSNPVKKFVAYGNSPEDLTKFPKWQATIAVLWYLLNPIGG